MNKSTDELRAAGVNTALMLLRQASEEIAERTIADILVAIENYVFSDDEYIMTVMSKTFILTDKPTWFLSTGPYFSTVSFAFSRRIAEAVLPVEIMLEEPDLFRKALLKKSEMPNTKHLARQVVYLKRPDEEIVRVERVTQVFTYEAFPK